MEASSWGGRMGRFYDREWWEISSKSSSCDASMVEMRERRGRVERRERDVGKRGFTG